MYPFCGRDFRLFNKASASGVLAGAYSVACFGCPHDISPMASMEESNSFFMMYVF